MSRRVLIIGCNLAGLTAAFRLQVQGYHVTILGDPSQSDFLSASFKRDRPDPETEKNSCQSSSHFRPLVPFIHQGYHHSTSSLLHELGQVPNRTRFPLVALEFFTTPGHTVTFRSLPLPSPLHVMLGMLIFPGFSLRTRWSLVNYLEKLCEGVLTLPSDLDYHTAESWLTSIGQPHTNHVSVWNPLCRFLLGDHLACTSAALFLATLRRCFWASRNDSQLSVGTSGIYGAFIQPLQDRLSRAGVTFQDPTPVTQIQFDSGKVTGVRTQNGRIVSADWYIAAVSASRVTALLPERLLARWAYFHHLTHFRWTSFIITHFSMNRHVRRPRLVLSDGTFHGIVLTQDPDNPNQRSLASCMATGNTALLSQPDQDLLNLAHIQVQQLFPPPPAHTGCLEAGYSIVREPLSSFAPHPGISAYRPPQESPIPNLFLAGDWTDTGLPAGTESAIVSGNLCAQKIQERSSRAEGSR